MTYEVQGHIDGTHSDPVIAVTRHGQVISGSRTGQSSLLVTALEDFGVNQSVVILVKVAVEVCHLLGRLSFVWEVVICLGGCHLFGKLSFIWEVVIRLGGCHSFGRLSFIWEVVIRLGGCHLFFRLFPFVWDVVIHLSKLLSFIWGVVICLWMLLTFVWDIVVICLKGCCKFVLYQHLCEYYATS